MFLVYKITSPSGRCYIGLTGNSLRKRWQSHVTRAIRKKAHHPLSAAIRRYGKESFCLEVIHEAETLLEAQCMEIAHICSFPEGMLYNLTLGGETDAGEGGRIFWSRIKQNPEEHAAYLKKLSDTKKQNDWSDYASMTAANLQWRKDNPEKAYKICQRNIRLANRASNLRRRETKMRQLKERLMWKHKRGVMTRKHALALWARRTEIEKQDVGAKIAEKQREHWAGISDPKVRSAKTADARAAIDRSKQGPAASKGVRKYWVDLKADPVRYAAYRAKRGWKP